jgi:DegV family protein with EDD domain
VPRTRLLVGVRTLKNMVRSGRVSPMAGLAAKALNLKPIVSMSETGETRIFDKAFSRRGLLKKILRQLGRAAKAGDRVGDYCILHAHDAAGAAAYAAEAEAAFGREPAFVMDISPAIGLHAGLGAVALAFLTDS